MVSLIKVCCCSFRFECAAGCRMEREREECSSSAMTPHRLCFVCRAVSCIHRKRSYWKQIFSDSWFEPKPDWKHSQLLRPAHRRGGRNWGRGQLWNSSPSSYRVWGISFIIFLFFMTTYFLPLSFSHSPHQTAALSSSRRSHVSLLSAVWFFEMSTDGSLPGRRSYPSLSGRLRVHAEPWSDGTARAQT